MTKLIDYNPDLLTIFNDANGINGIISTVEDPTDDSFMFLVETLQFFSKVIQVTGNSFTKNLFAKKIPEKFLTYYNNLSKKYNQFKIKALTIEKALDSIEYHKSETTRAILNTLKKINTKDIVPMDIALYYVSCETLSQTLLEFFE